MEVPFLGKVPLDPRIGRCCDEGKSFLSEVPESPAANAYKQIIQSTFLISVDNLLKAAKYKIQKTSTCRATLFHCIVWLMFRVFHLALSTYRVTKHLLRVEKKLLRKVECWSTVSNKFWLCCSFFIKLSTCHAANLLKLRDKLRSFVSRISPP